MDRTELRWNGWGRQDAAFELAGRDEAVWHWLGQELGVTAFPRTPATALDDVGLPGSRLSAELRQQLEKVVGRERVKSDDYERAFHALGKSYCDLLRLRAGDLSTAPDAIVYPTTGEAVLGVLQLATEHNIAVVPYGGGSSVVGGVSGEAGQGQAGVVTLDTSAMDELLELDELARTASFQSGIYGPKLEAALQRRGFTLGHYPQSFEFSTLGGWIAARGAGQQSNRYGKAEEWLVSATLATPTGLWTTGAFPASAAGPDLNHVIAGSEGALGVITEATVKIHPLAEERDYRGFLFPDFERGVAAIREIVHAEVPTAMIRLSDPPETHFFSAFAAIRHPPSSARKLAESALGAAGWGQHRCMMLIGVEGDKRLVHEARSKAASIARSNRGIPLGRSAGERWYKTRFAFPYLRDPLMDRGIGVDTLETSTRWSNIHALHERVRKAIAAAVDATLPPGSSGMVMAHISHAYHNGASLYFTFVFPRSDNDAIEQWRSIKQAASDAIAKGGGTISHHHGVGTDHRPWLRPEKGEVGMAMLGAMKHAVDPKGIMNPGKLF